MDFRSRNRPHVSPSMWSSSIKNAKYVIPHFHGEISHFSDQQHLLRAVQITYPSAQAIRLCNRGVEDVSCVINGCCMSHGCNFTRVVGSRCKARVDMVFEGFWRMKTINLGFNPGLSGANSSGEYYREISGKWINQSQNAFGMWCKNWVVGRNTHVLQGTAIQHVDPGINRLASYQNDQGFQNKTQSVFLQRPIRFELPTK